EVIALVGEAFPDHPGDLDAETFRYGTTRDQALRALDAFVERALPEFGDFQDAMVTGEHFLAHSLLSAYLNCGLLTPMEVCEAAEEAYRGGAAPLNAVEGFIRQIIGWREYVRGLYWLKMPEYRETNFLDADAPLPEFYWTGETEMVCMAEAVRNTMENAYAHHIQRLMVLGNYAMLAGVAPREIQDWFLTVYADAYEWVELPNVHGMAVFADGGVMASKPYAASGAYISRMSDHCKSCRYDPKQKVGDEACPFTTLFWDFLSRNRQRLEAIPRMGMMYRNLDRISDADRRKIKSQADALRSAS
ncbi:MAG: cryptochrome/photolyase family protein, partial [Pseudomonadota bacterium]